MISGNSYVSGTETNFIFKFSNFGIKIENGCEYCAYMALS